MRSSLLLTISAVALSQPLHPQYIAVNKASFINDPFVWDQNTPSSASQASIDEILTALNNVTGTPSRRLAVAHQITVMGDNVTSYTAFLQNMFALSEANDLPIAVALDPFQFWDARPDLWNWFDSSSAGFNPANIANVEWASWNASNATMIAWRDWGSQFRVKPQPNVASPAVLAAAAAAVRPAAALIASWYASLPQQRKYLLAGVKVGWEVNVGANYYYYPNGNQYEPQPAKQDPTTGIVGAVQLGYNAVCTAGLACSGNITVAQLDTVVSNYIATIATSMLRQGLPRSKLLTHTGPSYNSMGGDQSRAWTDCMASVIPQAQPGFSFYKYAYNVADAAGLDAAIDAVGGAPWSASEWLYMGGNGGTPAQQWQAAFENTINYRNNRFLAVFNWESIKTNADALSALQTVLNEQPSCLVDAPTGVTATVTNGGQGITVGWTPGINTQALMLQVATLPDTLPSGALASPYLQNPVTGSQSSTIPVPGNSSGSTLYLSLTATGCSPTQSLSSDVISLLLP